MAFAQLGLGAEIGHEGDACAGQGGFAQSFTVVGGEVARHGDRDALASDGRLARLKGPGRGVLRAGIVQTVMGVQLGRGLRLAVFAQIGAGGHQHRFGVAQRPGHMGVGRAGGVADGQVVAFGGQSAQTVRHVQLDANIWKVFQKSGELRHQLLTGQRHRRRHAQQATGLLGQVAYLSKALLDLLERGAGFIHQPLTRLGQAQAAGGALYQSDFSGPLQLGNALAHRGLAHAQAGGGGRVTALLRQHAQPMQVRPKGGDFLLFHRSIVHHFEQSIQLCALVGGRGGAYTP